MCVRLAKRKVFYICNVASTAYIIFNLVINKIVYFMNPNERKTVNSLLDVMEDGREFESLLKYNFQERGEEKLKNHQQPDWSDIQILKNIDVKDLGRALSASNHSTEMVKEFLCKYKFNSWKTHSNNHPVSLQEKEKRAEEIAKLLCDHSVWKSHGHTINRDAAWNECKLKITHAENIEGLDRAMRRMWALLFWIFENTMITKMFVSDNYCIIRQTAPIINNLRPTR